MIVTVTPNPSLDRTLHVGSFRAGAVHRATSSHLEPSGKGVNVAITLHGAGNDVTAVVPIGGYPGRQLAAMLTEEALPFTAVPIAGDIRTNVTLIDDEGTTSKVNEPGPSLTAHEVADVVRTALAAGRAGEWIAWCGSLPSGFTDADLAAAIAGCRASGRHVVLDTSGSALTHVIDRGDAQTLPHLIKPNVGELADLVGVRLSCIGDVIDAAHQLVRHGIETVLVSLGADGAVLVDADNALYGQAPVECAVNSAGAGDAFLAGYLAASQEPPQARLETALRFGAAAVLHSGTVLRRANPGIRAWSGAADPRRLLRDPASPTGRS